MPEETQKSKYPDNKFFDELNKMLKQMVTVKTTDGETIEGRLTGFQVQHLNVSIMTGTEKIIVRNLSSIRRKRDKEKWEK